MPTLSTRGAGSKFGYWTSSSTIPIQISFGMFVRNSAQTGTSMYEFATGAVTTGTLLSPGGRPYMYYGMAVGNSVLAIVVPADYPGFPSTRRYTWASKAVIAGTSLTAVPSAGTAFGIVELGIIAIGNYVPTLNKYVYATNVVTVTTSLPAGQAAFIGSFGSATFGISQYAGFAVCKYTYATDAVAPTTSLTTAVQGVGMGNEALGIMSFANTGHTTSIYAYANDTTSAGNSYLAGTGLAESACGNNVLGVINMKSQNVTNVYTYASTVWTVGTQLNIVSGDGAAAVSNGVTGVNV